MTTHDAQPQVISTPHEMRELVEQLKKQGKSVGVIPTMGALHAGHLSLVKASNDKCDATIVTIFVNPTQFAPDEDFQKYPRDLASDLSLLAPFQVDYVFAPSAEAMYSPGKTTHVVPHEVAARLEGESRPEHFGGVATVVLKLFLIIPANVAFFGQKDFQQALIIKRMVDDLNVPIEIDVRPIVREADGLALSSRNRYLSDEEREKALSLSRALRNGQELITGGETQSSVVCEAMKQILSDGGVDVIEYVTLADAETLRKVQTLDGAAVALIAARVGKTRLIDNMRFE